MGFIGINEQNKQRINLSTDVFETIIQDVTDFNLKNINELVNNVLIYSFENLDSTETILQKYKESLYLTFLSLDADSVQKDVFIDHLLNVKKEKLINEMNKVGTHKRKSSGTYIRLSNSVRRYLESDFNHEDLYFYSLEHFINYKLTIYAKKDYCDREIIALNSRVLAIEKAIADKSWLDLYFKKYPTPLRICPITLETDPMKTHIYLACYKLLPDNSFIPTTYRISGLTADFEQVKNIPYVDNSSISRIKDLIKERGIQFLTEPATQIQVRLTQDGVRNYNRTATLRPLVKDIQEDVLTSSFVYTFFCTERQAEYYFSKFNSDVEILSPISLRTRFKEQFENTLALYK